MRGVLFAGDDRILENGFFFPANRIIEAHHISEAISYRSLDRNLWG